VAKSQRNPSEISDEIGIFPSQLERGLALAFCLEVGDDCGTHASEIKRIIEIGEKKSHGAALVQPWPTQVRFRLWAS
jgi:hypothetical protein